MTLHLNRPAKRLLAPWLALLILTAGLNAQPTAAERGRPEGPQALTASEITALQQRKQASRAALLAAAEQAAADLEAAPTGARSSKLRHLEASHRLLAELLADGVPAAEVLTGAETVRRDVQQPAADRHWVARLLEMAGRKGRPFPGREAWLAERENAARRLLEEFPDLEAAQMEVLEVALHQGPEAAAQQARLALGTKPGPAVQARAEAILARAAADGSDWPGLLADVPGVAVLLDQTKGKLAVFYTWQPEDTRGMAALKKALTALPADTVLIGINLSRDIAGALRTAATEALPGEQLYGGGGFDSPVVRKLGLTEPAWLGIVHPDGTLRLGSLAQLQDELATL